MGSGSVGAARHGAARMAHHRRGVKTAPAGNNDRQKQRQQRQQRVIRGLQSLNAMMLRLTAHAKVAQTQVCQAEPSPKGTGAPGTFSSI